MFAGGISVIGGLIAMDIGRSFAQGNTIEFAKSTTILASGVAAYIGLVRLISGDAAEVHGRNVAEEVEGESENNDFKE